MGINMENNPESRLARIEKLTPEAQEHLPGVKVGALFNVVELDQGDSPGLCWAFINHSDFKNGAYLPKALFDIFQTQLTLEDRMLVPPQFGGVRIKDGAFHSKNGWTSSPATGVGPAVPVGEGFHIYPNTQVSIFSNGTEYMIWEGSNCGRCKKLGNCALNYRVRMASMGEGTIPWKAANRIGTKEVFIQTKHIFARIGRCKELVFTREEALNYGKQVLRFIKENMEKGNAVWVQGGRYKERTVVRNYYPETNEVRFWGEPNLAGAQVLGENIVSADYVDND